MEKESFQDTTVESEKIAVEVTPPRNIPVKEEPSSEDIEAHIVNDSPAPSPVPALATPESSSKMQGKSQHTDNSPGEDEGAKDEIRSILEQFDPLSLSDQQNEEHLAPERPKPTRKPSREPEPPFDFNKFLEQMRQKSADPIAKYLKRCVPTRPSPLLILVFFGNLERSDGRPMNRSRLLQTFLNSSLERCKNLSRGRTVQTQSLKTPKKEWRSL